jgi:UDP-N-acetylglucosamine acyltransferase
MTEYETAMPRIDPTAQVAEGARLGAGVEIGPWCIVGPDVTLGDGCRLIAQAHVTGITTIGARTVIWPHAVVGTPPQSVHYNGEPSRLHIGTDCIIREGVTINTGSASGLMETRIGDHCFLMAGSHVAHDCIVGNHVIFANNATLGGHVEVGDHVFLGGLCAVHQFTRIGAQAVIGGLVGVGEDIIPFGAAIGHRGELGGLNIIGLKRRGYSREAIHRLRDAYRMLFFGEGSFRDRVERTARACAGDEDVGRIISFVQSAGKRPIAMPRAQG